MNYRVNEELRATLHRNVSAFPNRNSLDDGLKHAAVTLTIVDNADGEGAILLTRRAAHGKAQRRCRFLGRLQIGTALCQRRQGQMQARPHRRHVK